MNLFITDAREISIEMIPVTESPSISPMADTKIFMFTELEGRVERDGGVRESEGERQEDRETMQYEETIREVRLGKSKD